MLGRVRLVALLAHVRCRDDFAVGIEFVRADGVAQPIPHDVEAEATRVVGLLRDQGAHPADRVRAELLIGHQRLRHWLLGHGKIDVAVEPVDRARQAVAVVFQFQLGRLEQLGVAAGPRQHGRKCLDLPSEVLHVHRLRQVERRVDPLARVIGRGKGEGLLTDKGRGLAGKGQRNGHEVFPRALGRGNALVVARGVAKGLFDRQTQPLGIGRQHVFDVVVSAPLGIVEGAHAKAGRAVGVARQVQR